MQIEAFMNAVNQNDSAAIERTLSPVLVWFFEVIPGGETRTAYGHDAAAREIELHHGESMSLLSLDVSSTLSWSGGTGFSAEVLRSVDGVSFRQLGKGELRCHGEWSGIVVWSMGLAPS